MNLRVVFIYFKENGKLVVWKATEKMKRKRLKTLERKTKLPVNYWARDGINQVKEQVRSSAELALS